MRGSRKDRDGAFEDLLDFGKGNAVLAALVAIAAVPIEAGDNQIHVSKMSIVHTFVNRPIREVARQH